MGNCIITKSNPNIYSQSETIVGSFLGKPLYRKVIYLNNSISIGTAYGQWNAQTTFGIDPNSIGYLINVRIFNINNDRPWFNSGVKCTFNASGNFQACTFDGFDAKGFIFEYTKK